jgi:hypothetical protein
MPRGIFELFARIVDESPFSISTPDIIRQQDFKFLLRHGLRKQEFLVEIANRGSLHFPLFRAFYTLRNKLVTQLVRQPSNGLGTVRLNDCDCGK